MMSRLWTRTEQLWNHGVKISVYRSTRSRLSVAVGDVPGPMVNGCISFVTEADSDDGLPHTLEHLVFMGSSKYPFKGVLDIIANRCLASGTNAWTDQDHTAYTLSTVGSEGFFKVLPVYINHLLSPMLTDSQFATEVHHINGDGEDAGVVYSEMQDHESDMEHLMSRKGKEIMYPNASNPYRVDTGGRLPNLRDSCSVEKVRDYHKKYYHLSNMLVMVSGKVDHQRLLRILEDVEEEHLPLIPTNFATPFSLTLAPLKESIVQEVLCPSDDESHGAVEISWFGAAPSDLRTQSALETLFDYFSNTAVSPMQKDFILCEHPLASSAHFHVSEQTTNIIHLNFGGVPADKLTEVKTKFFDKTVREHLEDKTWDLERIEFLLQQTIQNELAKLETSASDEIFSHMIGHQLFDNNDEGKLKQRFSELEVMKQLMSEPASFWSGLVKKYLTSPSVTILGKPSEKLVDKVASDEKQRISAQRKKLGKEGLSEAAKKLADATFKNTASKPPAEVLEKLIVTQLEDFDRFAITVKSNRTNASPMSQNEARFLEQFPFPATLHHCHSNFIEAYFLMDSSTLTIEQRAWLSIFHELMFDSPATLDGKFISADDVSKLATKDLVTYSVETGVAGAFDRFIVLRVKVSSEKYANLSRWARAFLTGVQFEAPRIKMAASKLAGEAREKKRDGNSVAASLLNSIVYEQNSNAHLYDDLILEAFHEKVVKLCDSNPSDAIGQLESLRSALLSSGVNVHILCDVDKIDSKQFCADAWSFVNEKATDAVVPFEVMAGETVQASTLGRHLVVPVGGSESSFVYQSCPLDGDWSNTEVLLPTMLFTQYLSQTEGPLWRTIRGAGLAYGANIYVKSDRRQLTLSLYRCAQPAQAYEETKKIVMSVIEGGNIDHSEFEAAKRSLIYELMAREGTISDAGKMSVLGTLRKTPHAYSKQVCSMIWNLTCEQMLSVGGGRVKKLFENYWRAVAVHPSKVSEMKKSLHMQSTTVSQLHYKKSEGSPIEQVVTA